jgi:hypothetical protein
MKCDSWDSENQHGSRDKRSSGKLERRGGNLGDIGGTVRQRFSNRGVSNRRVSNRRVSNRRFSNRRFSNRRTRNRQERRALRKTTSVRVSVLCKHVVMSACHPVFVNSARRRRTSTVLQDASLASVPSTNFVWQHSLHAGPVLTHSDPTSGVSWADARAKRAERTAMVFIVRDRFEARWMLWDWICAYRVLNGNGSHCRLVIYNNNSGG